MMRRPARLPAGVEPAREALRTEIQALRAVAVALVFAEHLRPGRLAAGYVGLDAFFAVSGFLITRVLVKELDEGGAISPARFWARRARRILPAALLVLLVCAAGARALMLRSLQGNAFVQVVWSALYAQNWFLASSSTNYWTPRWPTPVLHFWSLSVEEQFYLAWPLLLLAVAGLARRRGAAPRPWLTAALSLLCCAGFAYGLRLGEQLGYVSTFARSWEFGLGGLLALRREAGGSRALRSCVSWAGLALLLGSALALPASARPPSPWALLPVAGTLAVIWAGEPGSRWSPESLFGLRPVRVLGDLSYSLYLWHWPVILFLAAALRLAPDRAPLLPALAASLALAALTKALVEDPVRFGPPLAKRPPQATFAAAAAAMALVVAAALALRAGFERDVAASARSSHALADAPPPCFGAASRDAEKPCSNPVLASVVVPSPIEHPRAGWDRPRESRLEDGLVTETLGGPERPRTPPVFALVGDSHAWMLRAAFDALADAQPGVAVTGCAPTSTGDWPECASWNENLLLWLRDHPTVRTVYMASHQPPGEDAAAASGMFLEQWRRYPATVRRIVVVRDNPARLDANCVERALGDGKDPGRCRDPRAAALPPDPAVAAAASLGSRARVLDLSDVYCDQASCPHVIGGVRVHADADHLTTLFARTLGPILARRALALDGSDAAIFGRLSRR